MLASPSAPKGARCGAGVAAFAAGTPCSGSKGKVKCLHSPHLSFTFFAAAAIFRPTRHVANCRTRPTPLPLGGLCWPPCGRLGPALVASSPRCGQARTRPADTRCYVKNITSYVKKITSYVKFFTEHLISTGRRAVKAGRGPIKKGCRGRNLPRRGRFLPRRGKFFPRRLVDASCALPGTGGMVRKGRGRVNPFHG